MFGSMKGFLDSPVRVGRSEGVDCAEGDDWDWNGSYVGWVGVHDAALLAGAGYGVGSGAGRDGDDNASFS